ncbi:hypothetical protein [Candidatus Ichthyocystis sparus]|uniref:hypothetical protein n=1 Tax=Candidatus Ichthyocystis sparus TaxID=1561004 RepID=UPI000B80B87B|nr:hypothetical protein [Candidatus Ichthyocystis sparus]
MSSSSVSAEQQPLIMNHEDSLGNSPDLSLENSEIERILARNVYDEEYSNVCENSPESSSILSGLVVPNQAHTKSGSHHSSSGSISSLTDNLDRSIRVEINPPKMSRSDKAVVAACLILAIIIMVYIVVSILSILYLIHAPGMDNKSLTNLISYIGCSVIGIASIVSSISFFIIGKKKGINLGRSRCVGESVEACEAHVNNKMKAIEDNRKLLEARRKEITSELGRALEALSKKESDLNDRAQSMQLLSTELERKEELVRSKVVELEKMKSLASTMEELQLNLMSAENRLHTEEQAASKARKELVSRLLISEETMKSCVESVSASVEKIKESAAPVEEGKDRSGGKKSTPGKKEYRDMMSQLSVFESSMSDISSSASDFLEDIMRRERLLLDKEVLLSELIEKSKDLSVKTANLRSETSKLSSLKDSIQKSQEGQHPKP